MFLRIKFNYFASLINGMHKFTAIETGRCANMCSIDRTSEREGGRTQKLILEKSEPTIWFRCVVVVVIGIGIGKALHRMNMSVFDPNNSKCASGMQTRESNEKCILKTFLFG